MIYSNVESDSLREVYNQIKKAYEDYISNIKSLYADDYEWMLEVVRQHHIWGKLIFLEKEHASVLQRREKLNTFKVGKDSDYSELLFKQKMGLQAAMNSVKDRMLGNLGITD